MGAPKVFIDGSAGTTGLRIRERLAERADVDAVVLPEELRKDAGARAEALNAADVAFLCLPDDAAREAVSLVTNPRTVIIDTSTAHRTAPGWTYGFPELPGAREAIAASTRIANPGCHAIGFISLVAPLVAAGLIAPAQVLTAFSLTGYSGGGKKMIAQYEDPAGRDPLLDAPRAYGLTQQHKHLPEMRQVCGLDVEPVFMPVVAPYLQGMQVSVLLPASALQSLGCAGKGAGALDAIEAVYRETYRDGVVQVRSNEQLQEAEGGYLSASAYSGRDGMVVGAVGNGERIVLVSRFDNLGKGASGAAIQNMNVVLGLPETTGLVLG